MRKWDIIYEDAAVLVVYKAAGIAVETSKIGESDLVSELKKYRVRNGDKPYIGVINRIDQPVEGLITFAKSQQIAEEMSRELREHRIQKKYYAVLSDSSLPDSDVLEDNLVKNGKTMKGEVVSASDPRGKKAKLSYITLKKSSSRRLVEITLTTGRFHQIRTQFASRMSPVVGDVKYGGINTGRPLALCSHEVSFIHPVTHELLDFWVNPKGEDFREFL